MKLRDTSALRSQILASVERRPDIGYSLRAVLGAWGQMALLLALSIVWPAGLGFSLLFILAMGFTQYRQYFLAHEACHETLFANRAANRFVGRLTTGLLGSLYGRFTAVHMAHHRTWGDPRDPGAIDYYKHFRSQREMLLFFGAPLVGGVLREKIRTNLVPPLQALLGRAPNPSPTGKRDVLDIVDLLFVLATQATIFGVLSQLGQSPARYLLFYLLPIVTVFLFMQRLRMYLEHGPRDYRVSDYFGENARQIARTHRSSWWEGPIFSYMNFRYHNEHHIVPSLPSCRLPEVHERFVRAELHPDDDADAYRSTLRDVLRIAQTG